MNNYYEGSIFRIEETQVLSDKFSKRNFVIVTQGTYPQYLQFELTQDRCDLIDQFKVNDFVKVLFNLEGRLIESGKYENKVFTNIRAWRIEKVDNVSAKTSVQQIASQGNQSQIDDDLPF